MILWSCWKLKVGRRKRENDCNGYFLLSLAGIERCSSHVLSQKVFYWRYQFLPKSTSEMEKRTFLYLQLRKSGQQVNKFLLPNKVKEIHLKYCTGIIHLMLFLISLKNISHHNVLLVIVNLKLSHVYFVIVNTGKNFGNRYLWWFLIRSTK